MNWVTLIGKVVLSALEIWKHRQKPAVASERVAELWIDEMEGRIDDTGEAIEDEDAVRLGDTLRSHLHARLKRRLQDAEQQRLED